MRQLSTCSGSLRRSVAKASSSDGSRCIHVKHSKRIDHGGTEVNPCSDHRPPLPRSLQLTCVLLQGFVCFFKAILEVDSLILGGGDAWHGSTLAQSQARSGRRRWPAGALSSCQRSQAPNIQACWWRSRPVSPRQIHPPTTRVRERTETATNHLYSAALCWTCSTTTSHSGQSHPSVAIMQLQRYRICLPRIVGTRSVSRPLESSRIRQLLSGSTRFSILPGVWPARLYADDRPLAGSSFRGSSATACRCFSCPMIRETSNLLRSPAVLRTGPNQSTSPRPPGT